MRPTNVRSLLLLALAVALARRRRHLPDHRLNSVEFLDRPITGARRAALRNASKAPA
jgi:hypothetical protein